jgi:HlyD family secretion protein
VVAPFAGLVVRRGCDRGSIVVPGATVLSLVSTEEIWVSAWVDETEMSRLKPVQATRVVFRSEPDRSYEGDVARLGRQADRETGEFLVDVRVRALPENWAIVVTHDQRALDVFDTIYEMEDGVVGPARKDRPRSLPVDAGV